MRQLMEGSEAMAQAAIAAGCRFFAGYPMTPFTELLEGFAKYLPESGGTCINAESELEAVGMAWGAVSTGARAATGSTGQGLSLMQESFSEITRAELPLVIFNWARQPQAEFVQLTAAAILVLLVLLLSVNAVAIVFRDRFESREIRFTIGVSDRFPTLRK